MNMRLFNLHPALAAAMLTFATGCAGAAPAVEIRMRDVVDAASGHVLLGDAAVIRAADLPTIAQLVALPLGTAPSAGRETVLRRDAIVRWVRSRTGLGAGDIAWSGAEEVLVRGRGQAAASNDAAGAVRKGDWAVLRARSGLIEIEDRVEILQDGAAGDVVSVRGSVSSASFTARVVSRGLVEAQP